ncbi:MAG: hypothetical protein IPP72_00015 [Chitinophagaceae bacterium]|nr:hypothetical protein [Chitinophagaceae bacterium]
MKLVIPATYQYAMLFSSYDYFEKSKYKWRGFFLSAKFATIFKDKMVSRINKAGKVVCSITQALYSSESFSCYFLSRVRAADGHWNFDHIIPEDSADRVIDSIFKLEWKRNNISRRAVFYQSTDTTFTVIDYGDTAIYSAEPVRRPTGNFYIGKRGNKFGLLTDSNRVEFHLFMMPWISPNSIIVIPPQYSIY